MVAGASYGCDQRDSDRAGGTDRANAPADRRGRSSSAAHAPTPNFFRDAMQPMAGELPPNIITYCVRSYRQQQLLAPENVSCRCRFATTDVPSRVRFRVLIEPPQCPP